jgi:hypothetical protein
MGILEKIGKSKAGQAASVMITIVAVIFIVYQLHALFGVSSAVAIANQRIFICSETGKSFRVDLTSVEGQTPPIQSPYSGKKTAYPAELCYWTADGKVKTDPTPVLLNQWVGKDGPTFCPDCGRLVVGNNPAAMEGKRPPPTRDEWMRSHDANR